MISTAITNNNITKKKNRSKTSSFVENQNNKSYNN